MQPASEIRSFTGLRGVAAWAIVVYHMKDYVPGIQWLYPALSKGYLAVDLFFAMSGFVLALSYGALFQRGFTVQDHLRFVGFRLARVYPLHIVILALFLSYPLALTLTGREPDPGLFRPGYFAQSVFLVQDWGFAPLPGWNIPAWSISAELMFYILFPALVFLSVPLMRTPAGLVALGVGLLLAVMILGHHTVYLGGRFTRFGALRCLLECMLGICLFHAAGRWPPGRGASWLLLTAAALLTASFGVGLVADYVVMPAAFACLLWALLEPSAPLSRLLASPPLLWLGRISFSTYLVHYLAKYWATLVFGGRLPNDLVFLLYAVMVLSASILLYHFVEVPGRRAGRWLTDTLLPRGPARRPLTQAPVRAPLEKLP